MALTKAQVEAKKLEAEIKKLEADDRRAQELHEIDMATKKADLIRVKAEAEEAKDHARQTAIARAVADDDEANRTADNFHHRVYRFTTQVNASTVAACMSTLDKWHRIDPDCSMEIVFTSPGGDVIHGMSLVDHLRSYGRKGHQMIIGTEGWAASMAAILLQAADPAKGDIRWIGQESWLLIHEISFGAEGTTSEVADQVEWCKRVQTRTVRLFIERATAALELRGDGKKPMTEAQFKAKWKRTDWTLDSAEAYELGFVDQVR